MLLGQPLGFVLPYASKLLVDEVIAKHRADLLPLLAAAAAAATMFQAAISAKQPDVALKRYEQAMAMAPDVVELQFWAAVSMYTNGRAREALALFHRVFAHEARWVPLIPRLAKAGLFPDDARKIAEVQGQAVKGATW